MPRKSMRCPSLADKRLLGLIRGFLTAGVLENGLVGPTTKGTPQGGPLSPLLSNLMLDVLDRELEKRGHRFVRYADDCVPRRHEEAWMMPVVAEAQVLKLDSHRRAVLHERWGLAPRSRCAGGGFKPPTAAVFKRHGGERVGKRRGRTLSGKDRGVERK